VDARADHRAVLQPTIAGGFSGFFRRRAISRTAADHLANIPGRTATNMLLETMSGYAKRVRNIVGVS